MRTEAASPSAERYARTYTHIYTHVHNHSRRRVSLKGKTARSSRAEFLFPFAFRYLRFAAAAAAVGFFPRAVYAPLRHFFIVARRFSFRYTPQYRQSQQAADKKFRLVCAKLDSFVCAHRCNDFRLRSRIITCCAARYAREEIKIRDLS